ncbi:MAG: hypothetical protein QW613_07180 [Thermoprotei archaeon]
MSPHLDDQTLRIACTQVASSRSKEDNLQKIEKYARLAKRNGAGNSLKQSERFLGKTVYPSPWGYTSRLREA